MVFLLFELHSVEEDVTIFEQTVQDPMTDSHRRTQNDRNVLEQNKKQELKISKNVIKFSFNNNFASTLVWL
jgi:hypothetical protein